VTSCWIGVVAGNHVKAAVAGGFAMFSHGRHEAAKKVQPGDRVAYYSPREGMNEGAELRSFTAIGYVLPGDPAEREMLPGMPGWYRRMAWLDAKPTDIYPLLDVFSFVTNRQHWGMYFRKSLFKIDSRDFSLIAAAMGVAAEFPNADQS
jgi:hypothetical protein